MKWWDDLSSEKKLKYTGVAAVGGGALLGAAGSRSTILGVTFGALGGAALWGIGVAAYAAITIKRAADDAAGKLPF